MFSQQLRKLGHWDDAKMRGPETNKRGWDFVDEKQMIVWMNLFQFDGQLGVDQVNMNFILHELMKYMKYCFNHSFDPGDGPCYDV